ncbi:GntR family transcriptional regulator, partial [bacterium]|nr:GntR family transcriptional regulator [bacterium]
MEIDKSSFTPLYYQIANNLRRDVHKGKYQPGEALPSEYQLMAQYGVSRGTVRDAIKLLWSEGLVTRHRGRGSFVT